MKVAEAMTAIASTLRPGPIGGVAQAEPDDRPPAVAADAAPRPAAQRDGDDAQARDQQRRAGAEECAGCGRSPPAAPPPSAPTPSDRERQRDAPASRRSPPRPAPAATRRRGDSLPGEQAPLGDAREPAQRPPDADHRGGDRRRPRRRRARPATRAASATSCRRRRPTRCAGPAIISAAVADRAGDADRRCRRAPARSPSATNSRRTARRA